MRKIRGSGLITPSSPDTTMPSKSARNAKHRDAVLDRAGDHLAEACSERLDKPGVLRVLRQQLGNPVGKAPPRVLPLVPRFGADAAEECFHRGVVAGEGLSIQMSRIPLEQHAAEVEHDDAPPWCLHASAGERSPSTRRSSATDSSTPATASIAGSSCSMLSTPS